MKIQSRSGRAATKINNLTTEARRHGEKQKGEDKTKRKSFNAERQRKPTSLTGTPKSKAKTEPTEAAEEK